MMKLKHLLALAAVAVGSNALAQTDVTSQYLVNASFEFKAEEEASTAAALSKTGGTYYGWELPTLTSDYSNVSIGTETACDGVGYGIPAPSEGNCYFFNRKGWANTAASLKQTVALPAGKYYISVDYKAYEKGGTTGTVGFSVNGASIFSTKPYFSTGNSTTGTYAKTDPWKTIGAWFDVTEEGNVVIAIDEKLNGASARADLYLDNVRLYKWSLDDEVNYANATPETPMDVTAKFVKNPYFDDNVNDWTSTTGSQNKGRATNNGGAHSGGYWENWNPTAKTSGKMYQSLTGLPIGKYRLTASAHAAQGTSANVNLFAGTATTPVVWSNVPAFYSVETTVTDGNLEIGLSLGSANACFWIGFDNVKLEYLGADNQGVIEQIIANISSALESIPEGKMNRDVASNLSAKISAAQAATNAMSQGELETILSELNDAKAAANASIADYSALITAIENVENIADYTSLATNKDAYTNAVNAAKSTAQTAYDEGTADANTVNALNAALQAAKETANIADFNYAKDTYPEAMATNWENTNQKGQHWDGTSDTGYYDTWSGSATKVSKSATVTLAPGNYILKAAGRGQAGTTTYIKVGDVQVNFTNKGDAGKGIDTDGNANFSDGTFANGAGRGWEWRFIEFTLEEETEVTLTCGYDLNAGTWASVCVPELYADEASMAANELSNAKNELLVEIDKVVVPTTNIGDVAFQYPTAEIEAIKTAIEKAKEVAENAETLAEVNDAKAAIAAIEIPALNAPAAGQKFHLNLKDKGTVTFIQNPAAESGYGIPFMSKESDNYAQAFALIPVESEENDMYIMSFEDYDGETRYICNGIPYGAGTGAYGIRTITDEDNALVIKVVATAEEGVYNLMNTSTDGGYKKLGSNGGDFYTDDKYSNFTITVAQKATATLAISDAQYGTFIAPFDAEIPEDVTVYTCAKVDGNTLTLEPATTIKANTAYIVSAESEVNADLTGWGLATKDAYETGVLTGSYELASVEVGKYLLQNNDKVGFYIVAEDGFKIGANRCYLTAPKTDEEGKAFYFDNATAIEAINALAAGNVKAIYNAAGAAQKNLVRGLNIVKTADGKTVKVMVK